MKKLMVIGMAAVMAASVAGPVQAKGKKVLLKVPVALSTSLPGLGTPIKRVAEQLKVISDGRVKMKIYEPGKLVAAFEILGAVSSGKINAGYSTAAYWAGKIPAAPLFSAIPFGPESGEYMAWLYYGNGRKLYQEMYDKAGYNVHVTPCAIIAPETSGWFAKPIEKPEDLKGLRMRFMGLGAKVMEKLGVSTSLLPGGEIFPALEKGAIDATEFSQPAVDKRLGFHKVVKYNYFPGWHQQATVFELLINKKTWKSMDKTQQAQVEAVCKSSMADSIAEAEYSQFDAMKENAAKNGVKIMRWSPGMLATFHEAWMDVVEEQKKDAFFAKAWKDLSTFREGYQLWKQNAFLPRR
ncbi:TRAP transporter substrate-binding protein [Magnetococcus sp. PR-3]|uniref:TRAP transporter substrate-binding protein n=1 Tax=Magnetococcus sp. PR-3 TaxID=3120355 RepID=UPI002FCE280D